MFQRMKSPFLQVSLFLRVLLAHKVLAEKHCQIENSTHTSTPASPEPTSSPKPTPCKPNLFKPSSPTPTSSKHASPKPETELSKNPPSFDSNQTHPTQPDYASTTRPLPDANKAPVHGATGHKPPWNSLFSKDAELPPALKYLNPCKDTTPEGYIAELGEEDCREDNWKNTLVGFCIGLKPDLKVIKENLAMACNLKFATTRFEKGYFIFKFQSFEDSQRVLETGPWFIFGHSVILKRGNSKLSLQRGAEVYSIVDKISQFEPVLQNSYWSFKTC